MTKKKVKVERRKREEKEGKFKLYNKKRRGKAQNKGDEEEKAEEIREK
jgi:hypothetical protein